MAERATPRTGKGGPGRAAPISGARVVPLRYARLIGGRPANDNPLPLARRVRRAALIAGLVLAATLTVLYLG